MKKSPYHNNKYVAEIAYIKTKIQLKRVALDKEIKGLNEEIEKLRLKRLKQLHDYDIKHNQDITTYVTNKPNKVILSAKQYRDAVTDGFNSVVDNS